jgi:uncharacterized protein
MDKSLMGKSVYVWKERFSVIKSKKPNPEAFANIIDRNETTVVVEESKVNTRDAVKIEKGWKILTFDTTLPFEMVGFMAKVSSALAERGVSIFVISAYSTDHILVKETDLNKARKALEGLGFVFE